MFDCNSQNFFFPLPPYPPFRNILLSSLPAHTKNFFFNPAEKKEMKRGDQIKGNGVGAPDHKDVGRPHTARRGTSNTTYEPLSSENEKEKETSKLKRSGQRTSASR
jgi:hypothetical protein